MGNGDDKNLCTPGKGCAPLIEASAVVQTMKDYMVEHKEESQKFWSDTQAKVDKVVSDVSATALRFNDGHHRMVKNEDDIDGVGKKLDFFMHTHEEGKNGMHEKLKKSLRRRFQSIWLVIFPASGLAIMTLVFIAKKHPEYLDVVLKWM